MTYRIAIVYASREGQTEKIAARMKELFEAHQMAVTVAEVGGLERDFSPVKYDGLIIGSSVHVGRYPRAVRRAVRKWSRPMSQMVTGFFSVSLTEATGDAKGKEELGALIDDFLAQTGWRPALVASFAGALRFSEYGFFKRRLMKNIAAKAGEDVDPSRDYEYTDWTSVEEFVAAFVNQIEKGEGKESSGARPSAP